MKILIADDEPDVIQLVTMLLKPEGFEVVAAETGEDALALMREQRPDLLILDILMPGGHGFAVLSAVRESEELRATRVLMLSSKSYAEDRRRALEAGADAYMTKPFEPDALLKTVRGLLGA